MTTLAVILTTLTGLVGLEWILRNALALRVWRRVFHVTDASPRFAAEVDEAPRLSVIVPAKDEAEHIGPCLQRLREQDYPNLEFIVVDDRSRDRTVEIVEALAEEDPRLRLLRIEELPPGWSGKVHALHRGIESARGEWFCMTDADCRLIHPAALSVAMEHARRSEADLLSLFPTMRMGGFWEYFLQPICIGVLMIWFRPEKVNRANKPHAFANGQFLLLRREAYEAIGTYQAMRDSLIEDMDLARRIKACGRRLQVAPTRGLIAVRMYTSLKEFAHGWIRIFLGCFRSFPRLLGTLLVLLGRGLTLTAISAVAWSLFAAGIEPANGWLACALIGSVGLAAQLVMTARYYRYAESRWWMGLLYPVGCGIVAGLLLRTCRRLLPGQTIVWKDTHYPAGKQEGSV